MLAMFLAFEAVGSLSYEVVNDAAEDGALGQSTATAIAALLFLGATGKSAQLPLYFWLPDAMEGPTPVSALIHAATMVTAGVFLMVRVNPVLTVSADWVPTMIAWIGVITALFAATIAVAQNDIKKVLAYSTVSQLGYMFLAVGSGAYVAAIFHMVTHAFFKALLFLGSGSVIHGMHDEQDMRRHGRAAQGDADHRGDVHRRLAGDRRRAAVRRLLVEGRDPAVRARQEPGAVRRRPRHRAAHRVLHDPPGGHGLLRRGPLERPRRPSTAPTATSSRTRARGSCSTPLVVLAALSIVGGIIQLPDVSWIPTRLGHPPRALARAGRRVRRGATSPARGATTTSTILMADRHRGRRARHRRRLARRTRSAHRRRSSRRSSPTRGTTTGRSRDFMGGPGRKAFEDVAWFDANIIDGAVNGAATAVREAAGELRKGQTGFVRGYAAILGIGVVAPARLVRRRARGCSDGAAPTLPRS